MGSHCFLPHTSRPLPHRVPSSFLLNARRMHSASALRTGGSDVQLQFAILRRLQFFRSCCRCIAIMWRITGTRINGTESVSIRWADTKLFQIACFESLVSMFNYCLNLDRTSTNAKPSMLCPRHCDGSLACSLCSPSPIPQIISRGEASTIIVFPVDSSNSFIAGFC